MSPDPYDLERFVHAQSAGVYDQALFELQSGAKRSHWIWFIFPQLDGLGLSQRSRHFGIKSLAEAEAYVQHPVLGPRLLACARAVLGVDGRSAYDIMGSPDDQKLRSCATLFAQTSAGTLFRQLLEKYFDGQEDEATIRLLKAPTGATPSA
ncbi:MAG: DUF1810 domain-containing protein [Gemmatimonadaceae bacterium]